MKCLAVLFCAILALLTTYQCCQDHKHAKKEQLSARPHDPKPKGGPGDGGRAPVPEPGTLIIFGGGTALYAVSRWRKR